MKYYVQTDGGEELFEVQWDADTLIVSRGGESYRVCVSKNSFKPYIHLLINNKSYLLNASVDGELVDVETLRGTYRFEVIGEKRKELERLGLRKKKERRKKDVHAPMPGLVVDVEVKEGQQVQKGQGIVIVEAMKMENELRAADSGVVKEVLVREGQKVDQNQLLIVIE
ncbi:MAG: biotin/lipoyl-containing protein [Candidatus Glassbacteria bacterium]